MSNEIEVIEYAKEQLRKAQDLVAKWLLFLEASNVKELKEQKSQNAGGIKKDEEVKTEKVSRRASSVSTGTLKSHILSFIKDSDNLFSGRDMFAHVVENAAYTGNYTSFAGKLSVLVTKGVLSKAVIDDVPNDRKYWYGLKEWWDNGKLKDEYQEKLDKKIFG